MEAVVVDDLDEFPAAREPEAEEVDVEVEEEGGFLFFSNFLPPAKSFEEEEAGADFFEMARPTEMS